MQTSNRFLDDMAKVAGGAATALVGIKDEIRALVRQQIEHLMGDIDAVPREEFEAVKAVAAKARAEQEKLEKRVAALEAALAEKGKGRAPAKAKLKAKAKPITEH